MLVHTRDKWTARRKTERTFDVKTHFPPGEGVRAPPWLRPVSVRAEIQEDSRYEPQGPVRILYPPDT